jgi:hypothetical protein
MCDRWHWDCGEQWGSKEDGQSYTMVIFSVTFAVPLLSLAFTYTCVGRRLWLRASPGNADPTRDLAQLRAKRKVNLNTGSLRLEEILQWSMPRNPWLLRDRCLLLVNYVWFCTSNTIHANHYFHYDFLFQIFSCNAYASLVLTLNT